jgi:CRISPR/Cas system-associated protein Cas10 (large subunit of type III CRISPR-Cas system)
LEKFIYAQFFFRDMGEQKEYENLLLSSMVHDIGKFWQGVGERGTHQELGAKFVRAYLPAQWQDAAGLISLHHDAEVLACGGYEPLKTLMLSDWLSSGEREKREEEKKENMMMQ